MDIDSKSPECRSLDDIIVDIKAVLNPEVYKNYDNMMNWLLGINTIVLFFMLTNYDKVLVPGVIASSIVRNIFLVTGIVLLMFSIVVILFLRVITFSFTHDTLTSCQELLDRSYKNVKNLQNFPGHDYADMLDSLIRILKDMQDLTNHIFLANFSTFLGLLALFAYFLSNISIFALGFFAILCMVFALYLALGINKLNKRLKELYLTSHNSRKTPLIQRIKVKLKIYKRR